MRLWERVASTTQAALAEELPERKVSQYVLLQLPSRELDLHRLSVAVELPRFDGQVDYAA